MGSVVSYSNQAKMDFLNVKLESLKEFGAVSSQVATEMAVGAREKFKTDFAISLTGIFSIFFYEHIQPHNLNFEKKLYLDKTLKGMKEIFKNKFEY
jgi:PncC family amidohydrolase